MIQPPANPITSIVQTIDSPSSSVISFLDKLEADKQAELVKQAQEQAKRAEEARMSAVWQAHPAGNDYEPGQCTFGVASWVKVPMGLGNANEWYWQAKEWGFDTGTEPRPGAVGVEFGGYYGHVVLVESVNPDGSILIKEQNYDWYGSIRERIADPGEFVYVYFN